MIAKTKSGFWGPDRDVFTQMLYADAVRGKDATGVFGVNKYGNVHWLKNATPSGWFVSTQDYQEFSNKIVSEMQFVIGHNRKATHGDKKAADAHPFIKDNITLVHNGVIRNHKELCKVSTVDSNAVANALAETEDIVDVISKAEGAFAFIWYDATKQTLHFIRNKERPLTIVETDKAWYLSSEALLAGWCLDRNNQKILNKIDCEEHTLYSVNLDKREMVEEKLTLKKSYPPVTYIPTKSAYEYWADQQDDDIDDDSLFITEKDVEVSPIIWANRGMQVHMEITEYPDYTQPDYNKMTVELTGKLLNCGLKGPTVKANVMIEDMEKYLKSCVIHGKIRSITYGKNPCIYLGLVTPTEIMESKNGHHITEEMWYSQSFPSTCTECNKTSIHWDTIETVETFFDYTWSKSPEIKCVCSKCQEDRVCTTELN